MHAYYILKIVEGFLYKVQSNMYQVGNTKLDLPAAAGWPACRRGACLR